MREVLLSLDQELAAQVRELEERRKKIQALLTEQTPTIMEGMEQMFLQEEGPFSPRHIILFNAALACCALMLFLLWSLPPLAALLALTLLTGVLVTGMWRFSLACIDGILRKG